MATNKHAVIRYNTLDKCLSNTGRTYTLEELIKECSDAISHYSGSDTDVSTRTIRNDLNFMESEEGYAAEIERYREKGRHCYKYADPKFSIKKRGLNESEASQLKESILTLSRFEGLPQFEWLHELKNRLNQEFNLDRTLENPVLLFEQNQDFTGLEHISAFYNAVIHKKAIKVRYQGFRETTPNTRVFHTYFVKQYNSRWFAIGCYDEWEDITQLSLDRVLAVEDTNVAYRENTDLDAVDYFYDVVGVSRRKDQDLETVLLKVDKKTWPYIKSKPLHGTTKIKEETEDYAIISLDVIINYELKSQLLAYGRGVEVLAPESFVKQMREDVKQMLKYYSN